ncbi:A24 family peptidase [Thermanaerosceptrum fracticalcis]|uniref:A24 family peptidase n=1 Tax=Thermanaerosceptrum fracticalcis TaxID=1712410 RepID=UPI001377F538|nr:prepilin peptidase [Thermanaerosceptrum fracticalcis]
MIWLDTLLFLVLIICAYTDLRYHRIPNMVLLPVAVLSLVLHLWQEGLQGGFTWLQGLGLGIALFILPFLAGGIGAGDVKLLGVIGALKGPYFVFSSFLMTVLAGGLLSVFILLYRGRLAQTLRRIGMGFKVLVYSRLTVWNLPRLEEDDGNSIIFPYGVAIVLGTITTYWVI